jgi:hypothetical protein
MKDLSNIGADRRATGLGQSIKHTALAVFFFYIFAGLFNGAALEKSIELETELGSTKQVIGLALIRPVAWLSRVTHAADLRAGVEKLIRKEQKKEQPKETKP